MKIEIGEIEMDAGWRLGVAVLRGFRTKILLTKFAPDGESRGKLILDRATWSLLQEALEVAQGQ